MMSSEMMASVGVCFMLVISVGCATECKREWAHRFLMLRTLKHHAHHTTFQRNDSSHLLFVQARAQIRRGAAQ